jgi:hypothetical protein
MSAPLLTLCLPVSPLPVMVMLLTSILVFLPAMMFCIPVALILELRTAVVLAACMMVVEVRSAFLVCFHLPPVCIFCFVLLLSQSRIPVFCVIVSVFTLIPLHADDYYTSNYGANKDNYDYCCIMKECGS